MFVQAQGLPIVPVAHALKSFTVNTWALSWIKYALVISFGFHWLEDGIKIGSSWVSVGNSNILALEAIRLDGLGCRILEVSAPQDPSNIDKFSENVFAS